jgi:cobaltochelatase CobN
MFKEFFLAQSDSQKKKFYCFDLVIILFFFLSCFPVSAQNAKPVRVVVISRFADVMQDVQKAFEEKYGAGLIELSVSDGNGQIAPEKVINADVIFVYHVISDVYEQLNDPVQTAVKRGAKVIASPPDGMERFWKLKPDKDAVAFGELYWSVGGQENLVTLLAFLYREGGGKQKIAVPNLVPQIKEGIWHPKAENVFANIEDYLKWYRASGIIAPNAPLVALHFLPNNYKVKDLAHLTTLVEELEKNGMGAVPAFAFPLTKMRQFVLQADGKTPIRMILSLNLQFSRQDDAKDLEQYDVPVMNLLTTRESAAEWKGNPRGLQPGQLTFQVVAPERMGANEPILFSTTEKFIKPDGSEVLRSQAVPERVEAIVKRTRRWLILQEKPNADKKLAMIYYNNPPGKGNLGASYLNLMPSMLAMIKRLKEEGYSTGEALMDEKEFIALLERTGRNIEKWAPGELDQISKQGVVLWEVKKYLTFYKTLPAEFREFVEKEWGKPEDSKLMTIKLPNGELAFVLPGVRFGNLFLGPQALRTTFEQATAAQHSQVVPPPHSYVAAYLWYRFEFKADAIMHVGRHGTLEWLPGKSIAQLGSDSSEVLLGDVPDPYLYIIDGDGEALQARRRGAGILFGHLTPLNVAAGVHSEYEAAHSILDNYERTKDESPLIAEEYKKQFIAKAKELKIDKHLGIDLDKQSWEKTYEDLMKFLHEVEEVTIPIGQHTLGKIPAEATQREALQAFIQSAFLNEELSTVSPFTKEWANALFDGQAIEVPTIFTPKLQTRTAAALKEAKIWLDNLRISPAAELNSMIKILNGKFIPSGIVGDPLRSPASLPSGRNLHDFDPALIPTKAAWDVGKRLATQTIEAFKAKSGKFPEKVSVVLWSGETGRSQGVMEAEIFYLLGVEPKWNARNQLDGLRLMSEDEIGRPRVDVLLTISGLYRDTLPEKVIWLDRAVRLAATAQDKSENVIRKHDLEVETELIKLGVSGEQAKAISKARVFSQAPGAYGTGGLEKIIEQSKDEGKAKGLAQAYLNAMNNAYSETFWGKSVPKVLDLQLKGNQMIIHSRSSNLYGLSDNDDVYQYMGGLNVATKSVNDGVGAEMYVNNLRQSGSEKVEEFRGALVKELSTRLWNKKWIEGQLTAGYAGARQFAKDTEYLYGWQATTPENMNGSMWQETYDVYVADKHGLKLDEFFEKNNKHAKQWQLARLLEIDNQGTYKFSEADRAELTRRYVKSVIDNGAACSANTCGNAKLHQFIANEAKAAGVSDSDLQAFGKQMASATNWQSKDFADSPLAFKSGLVQGLGNVETSAAKAENAPTNAAPVETKSAPPSSATSAVRTRTDFSEVPAGSRTRPNPNPAKNVLSKPAEVAQVNQAKPPPISQPSEQAKVEPKPEEVKPEQPKPEEPKKTEAVSGFTMEEKVIPFETKSDQTLPISPYPYLAVVLLFTLGIWLGWRRSFFE